VSLLGFFFGYLEGLEGQALFFDDVAVFPVIVVVEWWGMSMLPVKLARLVCTHKMVPIVALDCPGREVCAIIFDLLGLFVSSLQIGREQVNVG